MRNPIKNEATAFRFLLGLIGSFVLIVIGAKIDRWLGLAVFLALTAGAGWWFSHPAPAAEDDANVFLRPESDSAPLRDESSTSTDTADPE